MSEKEERKLGGKGFRFWDKYTHQWGRKPSEYPKESIYYNVRDYE